MQNTLGTHENALRKANDYLRSASLANDYRQVYHVIPPIGWMNDPNGLIYYQGEYHVFFQYHPFSTQWGPMHWGHVKSNNLIDWEYMPVAIAPSEEYDADGCFSGSAVNNEGLLTLIYTGNIRHDTPKQVQCIAISHDGVTFEKSSANPVIFEGPFEDTKVDFRDPKVWKVEGTWYMVVGARREYAKALLYRSENLVNWMYVGVVAESDGTQGYMWECPDLFELDGKHILIVSPIGMGDHKNIYLVGQMDYVSGKFTQEFYGELDFGRDFYAAQTFQDSYGRRILLAWMSNWKDPVTTQESDWAGSLTIPRELFWLSSGRLGMRPIAELQQLRVSHKSFSDSYMNGLNHLIDGIALEIIASVDINSSTAAEFGLKIRCSDDGREETVVSYHFDNGHLVIDRSKSGLAVNGTAYSHPLNTVDGKIKLHLFLDTYSVEIFANDGEVCMSNRIYPNKQSQSLYLFANNGDISVNQLDIWTLSSHSHGNTE